ncbi:MAG: putative lipid II flippase FtsW [Clostridiales bacterium]|nr:putative lipid II flippase FtsW [Clostridiales bacterium]
MKNKPVDYIFLTTILILLAIGLVMVFSSSSPTAFANKTTNHDSFYYLKKQFVWAIIGLLSMFSVSNYNYKNIGKKSILFVFVSLVLLVMVTIIGTEVNGAKRWLGFTSSFGFQPSEFAKIAILIFFSYSLSKNKDNLKYFWKGLVPYLVIVGIFAALLLLEPHFSCTLLIASTAISVLYIAGARVSHFLILSAPILIGISGIIIFSPYRRDRLFAFLDPFSDPLGKGYQIIQSLYAIGSGGIFGLGLGQSRQKYLYLPEPQNDFIFSILCEELGLVGSTLVIFLFIILIWRGFRIASKTPDLFGSLLACGITTLIAIQTFTNIAVVTSSIPATGMPLPFFSYGGTALVFTLSSMGIILNISRNIKNV